MHPASQCGILCAAFRPLHAEAERCVMAPAESPKCRIGGCGTEVPQALTAPGVCLDHFLDEAFARADKALARCQQGESVDSSTLNWLFADVQLTLHSLSDLAKERNLAQQSKILELLLCVANLNEYVAHHAVRELHPR